MDTSKISVVIDQLLNTSNKAILISGPWGIGKTFNVTKYCENKEKDNTVNIIRLSLFGQNNLDEIKKYIALTTGRAVGKVINSLPNSFNGQITANIAPFCSVSFKGSTDNIKNRCKQLKICSESDSKKYLVIFDDFERKSNEIDTKDMLGLFDELIAKNYKLVVICNYDKFSDKNKETIVEFQEKIFDRIYAINEIPNQIIKSIFNIYSKEISGLESELNCNLRMAIKIKNLYDEIINKKDINIKENDNRILMKCCVYVIMEKFSKSYSSIPIYKDTKMNLYDDTSIDCICKHDSEMYNYVTLLKAIFDIVERSDFDKINNYYKNTKNDILDERTFYLSDKHKKDLIINQYNKIINMNQCSDDDETKIISTIKDWISCKIKVEGIDLNKLLDVMYDNNIEFRAYNEKEKAFEKVYKQYVKNKKMEFIKKNLMSNNIKTKKEALVLISSVDLDSSELEEIELVVEKNDFLYEKMTGDINYDTWDFNHLVSGIISNVFLPIKEKAKQYLEAQKLKYSNDISCNERVEALIEQYY